MGPATQTFTSTEPLSLYRGGTLPGFNLAWERWGTLNEEKSNAVLVLGGLSASAHAAASQADPSPGWWQEIIGPGAAIDTDRFYVICINALGSCFGSTGPASVNPHTQTPWRLDLPELAMEDTAQAAHSLITELGIKRLAALVGPSMGGMAALAYLKTHPHCTERLALISTTAAAQPFALAVRALQREAIVSDPDFCAGQYTEDHRPETGMRIARKLGMITYRSADEWIERFGRARQTQFDEQGFGMRFEIEAYLETQPSGLSSSSILALTCTCLGPWTPLMPAIKTATSTPCSPALFWALRWCSALTLICCFQLINSERWPKRPNRRVVRFNFTPLHRTKATMLFW
jgi:homoserine O-acetyltransferase